MDTSTKLLLIAHPADRSVDDHPEVAPLLRAGWKVSGSAPRIVEPGQPRMLVTLSRAAGRTARRPPVRAV